jgi:hypothetical protein
VLYPQDAAPILEQYTPAERDTCIHGSGVTSRRTVPTDRQLGHKFAIFGACFRHNMDVVPPSGLRYVSSSEYGRSIVRDETMTRSLRFRMMYL